MSATYLTLVELADIRPWAAQGLAPTEIHKSHRESRCQQRTRLKPLCLTAVRKALRGVAHRGGEERRGAKRKLSQWAVPIGPLLGPSDENMPRGGWDSTPKLTGIHFCWQACETVETSLKPV